MMKRWMLLLTVILALAVPAAGWMEAGDVGMPETEAAPAATPAPVAAPVPTATPKWFTPIETQLYFERVNYDGEAIEDNRISSHLFDMEYITTHMAQMCVTYNEHCQVGYEIEYSAAKSLEFEVHEKITAPDGSIMEDTFKEVPYAAGTDEHCTLMGYLMNQVFADMYETEGSILPGEYLYEMSIDGEMIATTTLTVLESDFSPGRTDYSTALYENENCLITKVTLGEHSSLKILDIVRGSNAYDGYLFKVEADEKIGYVKCYNVFPVVDQDLLGSLAAATVGGIDIAHVETSVETEGAYHYCGFQFVTRGQAQYCVDQKEFEIATAAYITATRPYLPQQLQTVEAKVTRPNGKKETLTLDITEDLSVKESFELIRQNLSGKVREGEYQVEFYTGEELYAQYTASLWGETPYIYDGSSGNWDLHFYTRVIAPDGSAYESGVTQPKSDYENEDGSASLTYRTTILEETFAQMAKEQGIQCGIYQLEIYMNNQLVFVSEVDVLDDQTVLGMTTQQTSLYQDMRCRTEKETVPGGVLVEYIDGKTNRFDVKSTYGDWWEMHISAPVRYKENEGYMDTAYVRLLTDETLPVWLEKMNTQQMRKDWISLNLSAVSTANLFAMGSATEEVMTRGMAELAADNQAYRFHGILYYSLKEDRKAQFRSRITMPDGNVYEEINEILPSYNIEDTSLYWDYTPCNMLRKMKKGDGILPGEYHYEVTEIGSGMTVDGWFEILDLKLAMAMTEEDARIYSSANGSHVIGRVPIYSPIFLYDGWKKINEGHTTEYNEKYTDYNARVSWNGITGYMSQREYSVQMANEEELESMMGGEAIPVHSMEIIFTGAAESGTLDKPLTMNQAMAIGDPWGDAGIYVKIGHAPVLTEQLALFTFMVQAPSGRQLATSDMYVYFDNPGRDASLDVLTDGATISALLTRMMDHGNVESGIYRYSVMMNGEILAQTEFEVAAKDPNVASYVQDKPFMETDETILSEDDIGVVRIREAGNVNVRQESNADSRRLGSAKAGKEYPCVGVAENGWYQIRLEDGVIGYVSNNMSTLIEKE